MKKRLRPRLPTWTLLIAIFAGCIKSPDQRIAEIAQQSLDAQARQNERAMEQNQKLIEASKELVAADAAARAEMVTLSPLAASRATRVCRLGGSGKCPRASPHLYAPFAT